MGGPGRKEREAQCLDYREGNEITVEYYAFNSRTAQLQFAQLMYGNHMCIKWCTINFFLLLTITNIVRRSYATCKSASGLHLCAHDVHTMLSGNPMIIWILIEKGSGQAKNSLDKNQE